jgi:hypothetical protein
MGDLGSCRFFLTGFSHEEFLSVVNANSEPGIASVLNKDAVNVSDGMEGADPGCTVCEMAVVWAQNQLRDN